VHAKPGPCIDLQDRAAVFVERHADVLRAQVDPRHVQPQRRGGAHRVGGVGRVDRRNRAGGAAGGEVGVLAQRDPGTLRGHRRRRQPGLPQELHRGLVQRDLSQRQRVALAAQRVAVFELDQRADRVHAVARHRWRRSLRDCRHAPADHQHPVVPALDVLFDQRRGAEPGRQLERLGHLARVLKPGGHPAAVVAVEGFHHHRIADLSRRLHRALREVDYGALRHRDAQRAQQFLGQLLVAGRVHRHAAGAVGQRRLDAPRIPAVAQLEQAAVSEPRHRNAAPPGLLEDRAGAGAGIGLCRQLPKRLELRRKFRAFAGPQPLELPRRRAGALDAHGLVLVAVDDLVAAAAAAEGLAVSHVVAQRVLHFEDHVLRDVRKVGALA